MNGILDGTSYARMSHRACTSHRRESSQTIWIEPWWVCCRNDTLLEVPYRHHLEPKAASSCLFDIGVVSSVYAYAQLTLNAGLSSAAALPIRAQRWGRHREGEMTQAHSLQGHLFFSDFAIAVDWMAFSMPSAAL
jgi:hypothetical protein